MDLFYSHKFDPETPLEETLQAMVDMVRAGKALYVGISKYPPAAAEFAYKYLAERDVPCLIYQGRYNMLNREPDKDGILDQAKAAGAGFICFSPLAQGLLTNRYLEGIPAGSRMSQEKFLKSSVLTPELRSSLIKLNALAADRGQTLAQMALAWCLKDDKVSSVIVGASSVSQLADNFKAVQNSAFTPEELSEIDQILGF